MTPETEKALARLRLGLASNHHHELARSADIRTALAEIERLTNLADAERHRVEKLGEMVARLTDEKAAALAEIERLQADVRDYRETLDAWKKADRDDLRSARAAGYEAGQRAMRERAAHRMSCPCWVDFPGPGQGCEDPRGCFENAPDEIRALPILPEPTQEPT